MLPEQPSGHDPCLDRRAVRGLDLQLDPSVVEQESIATRDRGGQAGVGGRDAAGLPDEVAGHDLEGAARLEVERRAAREPAGANLRTTQILQDRHVAPGAAGRLPDAGE